MINIIIDSEVIRKDSLNKVHISYNLPKIIHNPQGAMRPLLKMDSIGLDDMEL